MSKFTDVAHEVLGDLLRAHEFERVDSACDLAIYESPACVFTVGHDSQRSYEIFVGLRRRVDVRGPDFDFGEILRAASVSSDLQPTGYAVRDDVQIRHLLETLATLLASHCVPLLRGDDGAWLSMQSQRVSDTVRYAVENRLRHALQHATEAWHVRDFARVVKFLGPERPMLSALDLAKLEYAERKLRPG